MLLTVHEKCGKPYGAGCHCFGRGWKDKTKNEAHCLCVECQLEDIKKSNNMKNKHAR